MRRQVEEDGPPAAAPPMGGPRRRIVNFRSASFATYSLQGRPQRDLAWSNISYDERTGQGFFLIRFAPGGRSVPHEHLDYEEFVVLEGEITDSDGHVYRSGDCVSLPPGSRHCSVSEAGCIAAVFVRGGFRTLDADESVDGRSPPEVHARPPGVGRVEDLRAGNRKSMNGGARSHPQAAVAARKPTKATREKTRCR